MLKEGINLQEKLKKHRNKEICGDEILQQVRRVLEEDEKSEEEILEEIQQGAVIQENSFNIDLLEADRVFHISQIQQVCIEYRLRFLPTKYFKSPIPGEALKEIKRLEQEHRISLQGFRIMAPSKHFKLENADDPILFAPIGNRYFYLIHKWGNDLHPLRKLLVWPLKTVENLALFTLVFSFLMTFVLRELIFSEYRTTSQFIMLFLFNFKSMVAIIIFYGIALGKNFNTSIWKSKYFNL